ncbi:MAG: hypothetical protein JKY48_11375 [Flavobacteriales bacterium]|nr:hypothetical protein [Flavobacteriales bacterium]
MAIKILIPIIFIFLTSMIAEDKDDCVFFVSSNGLTYTIHPSLDRTLCYKIVIENKSQETVFIPKTYRVFSIANQLFSSIGFYWQNIGPPAQGVQLELERLEVGKKMEKIIISDIDNLLQFKSGVLSFDYVPISNMSKLNASKSSVSLMSAKYLKLSRHISLKFLPCYGQGKN